MAKGLCILTNSKTGHCNGNFNFGPNNCIRLYITLVPKYNFLLLL